MPFVRVGQVRSVFAASGGEVGVCGMLDGIHVDGLFGCFFGYLVCGAWVAILYSVLARGACTSQVLRWVMGH